MDALDLDITRVRALHAIACGVTRLTWLAAAERFELAMRRHELALKAGFNPQQPRDEIGRWVDANGNVVESRRIRLAGDIPTGDSPEVPKKQPPTSAERTAVLKRIARRLGPLITIGEGLSGAASWVHEYHAKIDSYRDPPKSFEELRDAVSGKSKAGYQDHHIAEQKSAEVDGKFGRELIDSPDNIVRIPTMKHEDINGWYSTPNKDFGGMSPRDYLRDKSWDERRAVGLKALRDAKVLKP